MRTLPPSLARRLLARRLNSPVARHGVLGDLSEEYCRLRRRRRRLVCDLWYWRQAVLAYWRFGREQRRRRRKENPVIVLRQDLLHAWRGLRRNPAFTVTAVLTLALGVGAATTIFSFVQAVLLRPLNYPEPQRIVAVWPEEWLSKPVFEEIEQQFPSFEAVAGWAPRLHALQDKEGARLVSGPRVTARFFDVLQTKAQLGRTFAPGEERAGSDGVVVLSHGFWQDRFGGSPEAIGSSLHLRGMDRTVIGVMPSGLDFLMPSAEVAVPQDMDPSAPGYGFRELKVIGRLKKGVSLDQAQAEFRSFAAGLRVRYGLPDDWDASARLIPLQEHLVGEIRAPLLLLWGAVGLLMLIGTANLTSLFLARSLSRLREVSVRLTLGAGPGRILRHLLSESILVGLLGALPGILLAMAGVQGILSILPSGALFETELPRMQEVRVDFTVAVFAAALSIAAACWAGALPAWQAARTDLQDGLAADGRAGTEAGSRGRLRAAIVSAEVALVVLLLTGCGLLAKSYWRLSQVDPGFRPRGLLAFTVATPLEESGSAQQLEARFEDLQQRLSGLAGVESAAAAWFLPFSPDGGITRAHAADNPPAPGVQPPVIRWRPVTPEFFRTAGIPLLEGRMLSDVDTGQSPSAAVLSRAAAKLLFAGRRALGQSVLAGIEGDSPLTVVGIVGDVKSMGLDQESPPTIYRPFRQSASIRQTPIRTRSFLLRSARDPELLAPPARSVVQAWDSHAILIDMRSMPQAVADSLARPRGTMLFISLFTAAALILGIVGIYGVMAFAVRQRSRELGIRLALGATRARIVRHVLKDGLRWVGAGSLLGLGAALASSRLLAGFVFEIGTADPGVMIGALAVALGAALPALLIPAQRAGKTDLVRVLAAE